MGGTGRKLSIMDDVEWCFGNHTDFPCTALGGANAHHYQLCAVLSDHHDPGCLRFFIPDRTQSLYAGKTIIPGSPYFSAGGLLIHSADAGWTKPQCLITKLLDGDSSSDFVSRFFIHADTICFCSFGALEERVRILDENGPSVDTLQL